MTTSITEREEGVSVNGLETVTALVTFGDDYPTDGEPVPAGAVGLNQIDEVYADIADAPTTDVRLIEADITDPKETLLVLYVDDEGSPAEVDDESDQTGVVARVTFVGS